MEGTTLPEEGEEREEMKQGLVSFTRMLVGRWNSEIADRYPLVHPVRLRTTYPPLGEDRMKHLKARWEDADFTENLDAIFEAIHNSPKLTNGSMQFRDAKRAWVIDFDFVIRNVANYTKILEGKYYDRKDRGQYADLYADTDPET